MFGLTHSNLNVSRPGTGGVTGGAAGGGGGVMVDGEGPAAKDQHYGQGYGGGGKGGDSQYHGNKGVVIIAFP